MDKSKKKAIIIVLIVIAFPIGFFIIANLITVTVNECGSPCSQSADPLMPCPQVCVPVPVTDTLWNVLMENIFDF